MPKPITINSPEDAVNWAYQYLYPVFFFESKWLEKLNDKQEKEDFKNWLASAYQECPGSGIQKNSNFVKLINEVKRLNLDTGTEYDYDYYY